MEEGLVGGKIVSGKGAVNAAMAGDAGKNMAGGAGRTMAGDAGKNMAGGAGRTLSGGAGKDMADDTGRTMADGAGKHMADDTGRTMAGGAGKRMADDTGRPMVDAAGKDAADDAGKELKRALTALSALRSLESKQDAGLMAGREAAACLAAVRGSSLGVYALTAGLGDRKIARKYNTTVRKAVEEAEKLEARVYDRAMRHLTGL